MLQSTEHVYFSNYTYSQLHNLVLLIIECCDQPHKHHASIFDKYGDKRFKRASHFVQSGVSEYLTLPPIIQPPFPISMTRNSSSTMSTEPKLHKADSHTKRPYFHINTTVAKLSFMPVWNRVLNTRFQHSMMAP